MALAQTYMFIEPKLSVCQEDPNGQTNGIKQTEGSQWYIIDIAVSCMY